MTGVVTAREYHERTKHRAARYARGPETIDWTEPPDPFRNFVGASRLELPLTSHRLTVPFGALHRFEGAPAELSLESIGALFELTFAISAWKRQGPDQWALRCHPSSGNLHPTEAYLIARGVAPLGDGLYHYEPREHALEQRRSDSGAAGSPSLFVGMSSVHWREAWKYGERAFRYCQLDVGHALAGLYYAAAALGWRVRPLLSLSSARVASYLGLDRSDDFAGVEPEEPALIAWVDARGSWRERPAADAPGSAREQHGDDVTAAAERLEALGMAADATWSGRANRIDPHPMYRWPVIDEVALRTRKPATLPQLPVHVNALAAADYEPARSSPPVERLPEPSLPASKVIRARRSAQRFDPRYLLPAAPAFRLFKALLGGPNTLSARAFPEAQVHAIALVHRVDGLSPGVYALPRSRDGEALLRELLAPRFAWDGVGHLDQRPTLFRLTEESAAGAGRQLCCGQAIASDCNVLFALLGEFGNSLEQTPYCYRQLHWEAGLLGHVLYLEAQALGLAGTGIGCFFDDDWHRFLGLSDPRLQALYCFSVGLPLVDPRIQTMPPYPQRVEARAGARERNDPEERTP